MHRQLTILTQELADATVRARQLAHAVSDADFHRRPDPTRWSIAECLVHLNLTTTAYLPLIDAAVVEAAAGRVDPNRHYRRDLVGWLLSWSLEPPARVRLKTIPRFVPTGAGSRDGVVADFRRLQAELALRLEAASGLDLNRARVVSPFNARLSYNLYSCFRVLLAHERRHLRQAAEVAGAAGR